jgi:hypothetical protein
MDCNNETWEEYYTELFSEILDKEYPDPRGGRTFATPKDMAKKAIKYFTKCAEQKKQITFEGLRLYMKFWSREAFYKYENQVKEFQPDFAIVVSIIKTVIEGTYVDTLFSTHMAAARFVLQCNYGWVPAEKQIIENHDINVTLGPSTEGKGEE